MRNMKKILAVSVVVSILGASGVMAYAETAQTPAEIVSELTGKTVDELYVERQAGSTYGAIASDAGVLDEFQVLILDQKKAILDERVAAGTLTREQADDIYNTLVNAQLTCDGTGDAAVGKALGIGFGSGNGVHDGTGQSMGRGAGSYGGQGMGQGRNR